MRSFKNYYATIFKLIFSSVPQHVNNYYENGNIWGRGHGDCTTTTEKKDFNKGGIPFLVN